MGTRDEVLQRGLRHHRAGEQAQAAAQYRALLEADPQDADALHLLGVLDDARGEFTRAVALIRRALQIRPSPRFRCNLGMALGHLDRHDEALAEYRQALRARPDYPEALNNLGTTLDALGRPAEAIDAFRKALALRPGQSEWWTNLGNALRALRRLDDAETAYRQAIALSPARPDAHAMLGHALRQDGCPNEAEAAFRWQMALDPDDPEARINLAASLGDQDRPAEAVALLPAAIAQAPARLEAHLNLATALRQLGRLEEAEAAIRRALALQPDHPEALGGLGSILRELGRLDEAEEAAHRRALALRPAALHGYNDLAIVLADQMRLHEALAVLDLAASLDPNDADARHHRAFALLRGRLREGWAAYAARFDTRHGRPDRRGFAQPLWNGELLRGRTILLHAEQGLGDTLQFCRYAPLVAARGGRVVLEVQRPLRDLLASLPGVAQLLERGETPPDFDLHCPLLSLPSAFDTTLDSIPAGMTYLAPSTVALARWRDRPAAGSAPRRAAPRRPGLGRQSTSHQRPPPLAAVRHAGAAVGAGWLGMGEPAGRSARR